MDLGEDKLVQFIDSIVTPSGFESYPLQIGWYNEKVTSHFQFAHLPPETLAFVLLSVPNMFENAFLPFLAQETDCLTEGSDLIDACMKERFRDFASKAKENFPELVTEVELIHDFEMVPGLRRPKVLVQTAAHVAGAAYYYQQSDVLDPEWKPTKKMFGVCIHPDYGGWFAIRGVMIFHGVKHATLQRRESVDILKTDEKKKEVLERFNGDWRDCTYRDVLPVTAKYSEDQRLYFLTPPKERKELVQSLIQKMKVASS